jgi:hypothetical protein
MSSSVLIFCTTLHTFRCSVLRIITFKPRLSSISVFYVVFTPSSLTCAIQTWPYAKQDVLFGTLLAIPKAAYLLAGSLHAVEVASIGNRWNGMVTNIREGADKSLARPERKQAAATNFGIYSTHSPRDSIHFLVPCSTFCKPLKKVQNVVCPTRCPQLQWPLRRTKNGDISIVFFSAQRTVGSPMGQRQRIRWVIFILLDSKLEDKIFCTDR